MTLFGYSTPQFTTSFSNCQLKASTAVPNAPENCFSKRREMWYNGSGDSEMMAKLRATLCIIVLCASGAVPAGCVMLDAQSSPQPILPDRTALPTPVLDGPKSLEEILALRRSVREFDSSPLTYSEVGQLLWAAQGTTSAGGYRTAPSAGALYPLELYLATSDGVFHYDPANHELETLDNEDPRQSLFEAALQQEPVRQAPAVFVITAVYERTADKYGDERSPRYVHLEAGHAAQNLLLQATALDLGAVPIGAFHDDAVQAALGLPIDHQPLYLIPVGHPSQQGP
jgi:SagB-type dehydrogenase family enzyme